MAKIKNNTGSPLEIADTGITVPASGEYIIQSGELSLWAASDDLITALGSGDATINDGTNDLSSSEGLDIIKGAYPKKITNYSFHDKKTPEGKSLYNRTTGKKFPLVVGANTIDFDMPYSAAKFTGIEIFNGENGDYADLFVLDDDLGTYSTVPNYVLNQFGFNTNISQGKYCRESEYDADIYLNMCISITYYSESIKDIYVNYLIHEVKD